MDLIAYQCLECGHYTITQYDGMNCSKCKSGHLVPRNKATVVDKNRFMANKSRSMAVEVKLSETDLFRKMLNVLKEVYEEKDISEEIKIKIEEVVNRKG